MDLSEDQWLRILPVLEKLDNPEKKGRPRKNIRGIVNGILWVCRTCATWNEIPRRYAPHSTCFRVYKELVDSGDWDLILFELAGYLEENSGINILKYFKGKKINFEKYDLDLFQRMDIEFLNRTWVWHTLLIFINPYPGQYSQHTADLVS